MTEEENKAELFNFISPHFIIKEEVWGKHLSGDNVRIDAVIMPKEPDKWKNKKQTAFGVEIKPEYDSYNEISGMILQCIDYKYSRFHGKNGLIYLPILMYPNPLIKTDKAKRDYEWHMLRILGKMNIGVINKVDYKARKPLHFEFRMSDTPFWNSIDGVKSSGENRNFNTKFGRQ